MKKIDESDKIYLGLIMKKYNFVDYLDCFYLLYVICVLILIILFYIVLFLILYKV